MDGALHNITLMVHSLYCIPKLLELVRSLPDDKYLRKGHCNFGRKFKISSKLSYYNCTISSSLRFYNIIGWILDFGLLQQSQKNAYSKLAKFCTWHSELKAIICGTSDKLEFRKFMAPWCLELAPIVIFVPSMSEVKKSVALSTELSRSCVEGLLHLLMNRKCNKVCTYRISANSFRPWIVSSLE